MIIYFSKLNLESVELLEMYQNDEVLGKIRKSIVAFLKTGITYEIENSFIDEFGEVHKVITNYRLVTGIRTDDYIVGVIYKRTTLHYKEINEQTGEIEPRTIPTVEDVRFYFDINREIVGFHTRNRFGYQDFNTAFSGIVNMAMENNESPLRFSASLYNEGLSIKAIEQELKNISNIERLEFKFKLPNPADDHMIENLRKKLTDTVEELEEANAHAMSVIFDSDGGIGLNIEAGEIQKNISRVDNISSGISDEEAIQNGYAFVKATAKNGKIYTTEEHKPIKRLIADNESEENFSTCAVE